MTNQNPEELSKPSLKDIWYAIGKGTISIIPVYGATLSELISLLAVSPATKRRDKWVNEQLTEAFRLIAEKVDISTFENLPNNELFLTVVLQATSIALRNHQKEKLEALRNAIVNSVLPNAPNESLQLIFLNLIDAFTPCHIIMMNFIDNPREWCKKKDIKVDSIMDNYNTVDLGKNSSEERQIFLEKIFPEVRNNKYIYEQAVEELNAKRLLVSAKSGAKLAGVRLHVLDLHKSVVSLSDTGKQFLNYIKLSKETY